MHIEHVQFYLMNITDPKVLSVFCMLCSIGVLYVYICFKDCVSNPSAIFTIATN